MLSRCPVHIAVRIEMFSGVAVAEEVAYIVSKLNVTLARQHQPFLCVLLSFSFFTCFVGVDVSEV